MNYSIVNITLFIALTVLPLGRIYAQSPVYETPQYSGQTPQFDSGLDKHRDNNNALHASRQRLENIQRDRRNDLAVDRQNHLRSLKVQEEMTRKREESLRANQRYMLETNQ